MSSIFHTPEWLGALQRTYGYEPVVFTTAGDDDPVLGDGLAFCRVKSWMTGRRLVSLPFSDHCDLLVSDASVLRSMLEWLAGQVEREGRYIELRPTQIVPLPAGFEHSDQFVWHSIDLKPSMDNIFAALHKNHTKRAIRKAGRAEIVIEVGRSDGLLKEFYGLHMMTRHRHRVPVQPFEWFRNLRDAFGARLQIYVARYESRPVASILLIRHKATVVYKYGCSDASYNRYGATSALFWKAISDGKLAGCIDFDLGRSDVDDGGLIAFKEHLGAKRTDLRYYRYRGNSVRRVSGRWQGLARRAFATMPRAIQTSVGSGLYRHFA